MPLAIAGAHGKIGLRLITILAARGEQVSGLIRNPDHAADIAEAGGRPVVCDLERASVAEVSKAIGSADAVYLRAKAEADAAVMASGREWVIVRPGRLTDDRGTGTVRIDTEPFRGEVSRDDVAAVVTALIADPRAPGRTLYVNGGELPVEQALATVLA